MNNCENLNCRRNKPALVVQTKFNQYCPKRDFIIKCAAVSLIVLINVLLLVFDWYFQLTYLQLYILLRSIIAGYYVNTLVWMDLDSDFPSNPSIICTIISTLNVILLYAEMLEVILV